MQNRQAPSRLNPFPRAQRTLYQMPYYQKFFNYADLPLFHTTQTHRPPILWSISLMDDPDPEQEN